MILIKTMMFCCCEKVFMDDWEKFDETPLPEKEDF